MLDVAKAIQALDLVHAGPMSENWALLFNAKNQLEAVFDQSIYRPHLRISREKGQFLFNAITETIGADVGPNQVIEEYDIWQIKSARDAFQLVFFSELSTLPAFLVSE